MNQDFTMGVEELPIKKGERLIKALKNGGYKNIPENVVLSKALTGIGATYCEIRANRNSIIIEPNVPVILGKIKKHTGLLGVYDNCTKPQIRKYFLDQNFTNKKFLTTPEGFNKIREVAKSLNIDIYEDYFCLFDECEKITQDIGFRENISNPVYDFFKFKAKAFVSATPLKINHPEIAKQGFRILKVMPDYDYSQDIRLIVTNNLSSEFGHRLKEYEESECVCIFYNTTKGINRILNNTILSDYRVFCSDKSAKQLKDRKFENISSEFDNKLAKYNFFTSRFFSAVDMELDVAPDIIILTDLHEAEHSTIDPFTEAIQIQGRFRNEINGIRYKSITHITNIKPYLLAREKDAILSELDEYRINHDALTQQLMNTSDVNRRRAIEQMIKNQPYNRLLDKRRVINDFAVDNWINEERVNRYFTSKDDFLQAYRDTNFFDPVMIESIRSLDESASYSIRKSRSAKETIGIIVDLLQKQPDPEAIENLRLLLREDTHYMKESIKKQFDSDVIIDIYLVMGGHVFEKNGFNYKKVKIEFETFKEQQVIKEKRFSPDVVFDILDSFKVSDRIAKNEVKRIIGNIYTKHEITHRVTHSTIGEYFKVTPQNKDKPEPAFVFKHVLPEFLSLLS